MSACFYFFISIILPEESHSINNILDKQLTLSNAFVVIQGYFCIPTRSVKLQEKTPSKITLYNYARQFLTVEQWMHEKEFIQKYHDANRGILSVIFRLSIYNVFDESNIIKILLINQVLLVPISITNRYSLW